LAADSLPEIPRLEIFLARCQHVHRWTQTKKRNLHVADFQSDNITGAGTPQVRTPLAGCHPSHAKLNEQSHTPRARFLLDVTSNQRVVDLLYNHLTIDQISSLGFFHCPIIIYVVLTRRQSFSEALKDWSIAENFTVRKGKKESDIHEARTKAIEGIRESLPLSPEEGPLFVASYWHHIQLQRGKLRSGYYPSMLRLR